MQPNGVRPASRLIVTTGQEALVLRDILVQEGYSVTPTLNFEAALAELTTKGELAQDVGLIVVTGMQPALPADQMAAFLQGQLAAMDGLDFVAALRQHSETHSIPAILMTALALQPDKLESLRAEKTYHVRKPFNRAELHDLVARLIG